ncbi:inner centromere protein A-like isoform X2 [Gigantopelta aegis]|uniref:inner centromere protein A-like isoform X2 n=1 Tax=Gigantopelta aegis TaxID=1735272 RepID=UPI001B88BAA2|nr:inner centromere protein A-like isoform X2 [Gigantopelta aegis]
MTAKITHHAGLPYVQIIEEELQLSLSTIEDCFEWLNQSLEACRKSFARPDIELLPQTPHAKRCRRKRVLTNRDSEKLGTGSSTVESEKDSSTPCKTTRQTRTRHVKQTSPAATRVTRSTRSRLNFTNSSCPSSSQSSSPDGDVKTSATKPVYHVVFSPPPASPGSIVRQRTSAYEAMLEKKHSPSPLKQARKVATNDTPEHHSMPNTPETLKPLKVIGKVTSPSLRNSASKVASQSLRETFEITSNENTPRNSTPDDHFNNSRVLKSVENKRRSSRKSLKAMTKQLRKLSGRPSKRLSRNPLMESFIDQVEPMQCEEATKRPRTRLRLKKTTLNNKTVSDVSGREESVPTSSESNTERDHGVHLSADDKENKETNFKVHVQSSTEQRKTSMRPEVSDMSDSEHETFRVPRTKTRVKKVKRLKVQGSESDLPRTSCSDSDTSTERPVRQSTRTKTRKNKAIESETEKHSGSVSSEDAVSVFQNCGSIPTEFQMPDNNREKSAQRDSVDSGIVSTHCSASNLDLSSKGIGAVNVDNTIEEENVSTSATSSGRRASNKSDNRNINSEPENEIRTRTKTRKRQAEEEMKNATPKRSCTGSMTSFAKNEQNDHKQSLEHKSSESAGDSGNSDGDSMNNTPSPECPRDKVVHPRSYSFMSSMKYNTPKPSNILSGMITSFIKKTTSTPTQVSQQMQMEMRRKEFKEKQQREQDRIKKREELLKMKMEERKRKREERMRKVAEHREMKEKLEKEMKEQNAKKMVERLQTTDKLKEEKLKEEKELKARIRLKKQQEAEIRRKLDAEERLRKQLEMEEELKRHEDQLQRKREYEDQERQKKMAEDRKKYDRVADLERERLAELEKQREIRERQKLKEERERAHARERAEKERQELERRREREIALKKEMDKLKEMEKRRLQLQQQEEMKKEEQKKQHLKLKQMIEKHNNDVLNKGAMPSALININSVTNLNATVTLDSSSTSGNKTDLSVMAMSVKSKHSHEENYNITELHSDDSTDDDEAPRKKIPAWAQGQTLKAALIQQHYFPPDLDALFPKIVPPDLKDMFAKQKPRFNKRGSSAIWDSPLFKQY